MCLLQSCFCMCANVMDFFLFLNFARRNKILLPLLHAVQSLCHLFAVCIVLFHIPHSVIIPHD